MADIIDTVTETGKELLEDVKEVVRNAFLVPCIFILFCLG